MRTITITATVTVEVPVELQQRAAAYDKAATLMADLEKAVGQNGTVTHTEADDAVAASPPARGRGRPLRTAPANGGAAAQSAGVANG